jgi:arylesterase/paraoxonase
MRILQIYNLTPIGAYKYMAFKPSTIALLSGIAVVTIISFVWFRTASRAGEFTTLSPVFDGTCTTIGGLPGAEDIVLDRTAGTMFISSDDRRANAAGNPKRGAVYILPIRGAEAISARIDATGGIPSAFHPHGISRFIGADGKATLMVVNHPKGFADYTDTTVEIYDGTPEGGLTHRRTVKIPGLTRINDIAATGSDSFYATSESDLTQGSFAESWSIITGNDRSGAVWHFDGTSGQKLDSGIGFANSLALTPDGKTLYASGTISRAIYVYDRDPASNAIKRRTAAFVGTGADNLDVEPDGRVWVGTHPKLLSFVQHAGNPEKGAPSQVIILEPDATGTQGNIDQVYLKDETDGFSAVSVAVRDGDTMVLGTVFEPGIRVCTLPKVWKQSESHPAQRLLDTSRDVVKQEADKAAEKAAKAAKSAP